MDGDINWLALDVNYHNGPMCINCSEYWCVHCVQERDHDAEPWFTEECE